MLQTILEISKSNPELLELCILKTEIDYEKLLKNKKQTRKKFLVGKPLHVQTQTCSLESSECSY